MLSTNAFAKTLLLAGCAFVAIASPSIASAQDTPAAGTKADPGTAGNGDIIVTARKRAEDIQTVPISITAYTAADLTARNVSNLNDLANVTPGLSITQTAGGGLVQIFLRGVAPANVSGDLNVEGNVGVFIDGIYQTSRNTLDIISVLDIGQIEIAKGPQSALFGRSTFAGALSIQNKRPAHQWEGSGSATAGIDNDYRARATISGPIADNLFFRAGGGYLSYGGYGKNAANPNNNLGGTKKYAFTGSLEYAPTDDFSARLTGFITHSVTELSPMYVLPASADNCGVGTTSSLGGGSVAAPQGQLFCGTLPARKVSNLSNLPPVRAKTRQISLDVEKKLDGVRIVSMTGYTAADDRLSSDYDGSSAGTVFGVCTGGAACLAVPTYSRLVNVNLAIAAVERIRTFSQEIRLQSDNDSRFSWLFGGLYFNQRLPVVATNLSAITAAPLAANERLVAVAANNPAAAGGAPNAAYDFTANPYYVTDLSTPVAANYTAASTVTMSIFGSAGYKFGNLRVNAEGRYNIDRKRAQVFSINNPTFGPGIYQPIVGNSVPAAGVFPVAGPLFAKTFEHFAPRFTVDYQYNPDIFLYASAAKGYRSGGFNTGNTVSATGILASEVPYQEESNWTYETGFKTKIFNRRLLLNGSAFYTDWKGVQITSYTANPTAVVPVALVTNGGRLHIWGLEGQVEWAITDMFYAGGSTTYSNPKFQYGAFDGSGLDIARCVIGAGATATSAPGCPPVIVVATAAGTSKAAPSVEGLRPVRSVKLQWNAHAGFNYPLSDAWKLSGRVDVSYTGPAYNTLLNSIQFGKRTLTSARFGIDGDRYGISLWANNIFDKTYVVNSINQPRAGVPSNFNNPEVYLGEGRRGGVTVNARF